MPEEPLPTGFLPAEKDPIEVIYRQNATLKDMPLFCELLDSMLNLVLMLNDKRQIVFVNTMALNTFHQTVDSMLGLRVGDLFTCAHAREG